MLVLDLVTSANAFLDTLAWCRLRNNSARGDTATAMSKQDLIPSNSLSVMLKLVSAASVKEGRWADAASLNNGISVYSSRNSQVALNCLQFHLINEIILFLRKRRTML